MMRPGRAAALKVLRDTDWAIHSPGPDGTHIPPEGQKMKSQVPQININGTSGDELATQLNDAICAVRQASNKLAKASPHGRDYPQPNTYRQAAQEAATRYRMLLDVERDLQEILEDVLRQIEERERQHRK